jgi:hypothetical protein
VTVALRPASRLLATVAAATLAVTGLTACRSDPQVAAYVADHKITVAQVEREFAAIHAAAKEASQTQKDVVDLLVALELGRRQVAEAKLSPPAEPGLRAQVAQVLGLPADLEYVGQFSEWISVLTVLQENLKQIPLTDQALLDVYDALVKGGLLRPGASVEQVREAATNQMPQIQQAAGTSAVLFDQSNRSHTVINPRFLPVRVPLYLQTQRGPAFFSVPYLTERGAVTDLGDAAV